MLHKSAKIMLKLFVGLLFGTAVTAANSQTTVNQLLDSTFMHGQQNAAEMAFNDATQRNPDPEYFDLGITGTDLRACKLTALNGLFCLDGKIVRNWPNPSKTVDVDGTEVVPSFDVLDCEDPVLGLDTKKADTCTGLTVDLKGNIWLAGKNKGKTHSLIKLVPSIPPAIPAEDPTCPAAPFAGATTLGVLSSNDGLCGYEVATGRPLLVDIAPIDGDVADEFSLPGYPAPLTATLGLEQRKTAVAFLANGEAVEISSGKRDWGLIGSEQLMAITLLQLVDMDPTQNIILVVTSRGRVLAWDTAGAGPATLAFDVVENREQDTFDAGTCNSEDPVYSVRASSKTGTVYVTDSEYCEVIALRATTDLGGSFTGLENATELGGNLTLSTRSLAAPTGITVSPGISIDLNDCSDPAQPCPLVSNAAGAPIATLSGVQLFDYSVSGLSLFQVDGIPDCRYVPLACLTVLDLDPVGDAVEQLIGANVIVPLVLGPGDLRDPATNPAAQRLNITPLLPSEVTDLFPEGLPDLLLARYVRGQRASDHRFGGFFGITEDGVIFRDTFEGVFDVGQLAGSSLGCADNLGSLLWDVIGTVSERYVSASDAYADSDPQRVTTIINYGCSSSRTIDDRWSLKPYNLEPTPCTFNPDLSGTWLSDGSCALEHGAETADDAVYAKMVLTLVDELDRTLEQLACFDSYGENGGTAPLSVDDCTTLRAGLANTTDKLHKCWDATQQPKQSSGDQNCQAFDSQLTGLQSTLDSVVPVGTDVANRVGELKARAMTIRHVFETRFTPSLPDGGFDEPQL